MSKLYENIRIQGKRMTQKQDGQTITKRLSLGMGTTGIAQYLENRTARVHIKGKLRKTVVLGQGVSEGGALLTTLFLVFANNICIFILNNVH
jgi:hypothetical protein